MRLIRYFGDGTQKTSRPNSSKNFPHRFFFSTHLILERYCFLFFFKKIEIEEK